MRDRLNQTCIGSWIATASPIVAEVMATEFDWLCVDAEHSPATAADTVAIFQAIKATNPYCTPFVRLRGHDYSAASRYLDMGAVGIIAPLVNTRARAECLVNACRYPPQGDRGLGFCRANRYGNNITAESMAKANDRTIVVVQIEHKAALTNLEAILSVPGVDAAFVGPWDLAASLGRLGSFDFMDKILGDIVEACVEAGVAPGIHVTNASNEALGDAVRKHFRLIAHGLDTEFIKHGIRK